tara:strand:- start:573 stop:1433 length:861 start_codon:yes stop_codon:yes gene_type:complete
MRFITIIVLMISVSISAQEIVQIQVNNSPSDVEWPNEESSYFNNTWQTQTVANVSIPTMEVFRPDPAKANGTSMVICPGGGMYLLSIESEGNQVAKWLTDQGVTAFVLKYRLVPTGDDGAEDLSDDGMGVGKKASNMLKYAHEDALNAITHIRKNVQEYGVESDKIGLMGFSAGGAVTMEATYKSQEVNRPNFIVPVYAWMSIVAEQEVPDYKPPMNAVCATDDPLFLAPASVELYSDWIKKGATAELHMYAKGGHGFGMKTQNLPTDKWIERVGEWMDTMGYMKN